MTFDFPLTNLEEKRRLARALLADCKPIRFLTGWGYTRHDEERIEMLNDYINGNKALWTQIKPLITYRHLEMAGLTK